MTIVGYAMGKEEGRNPARAEPVGDETSLFAPAGRISDYVEYTHRETIFSEHFPLSISGKVGSIGEIARERVAAENSNSHRHLFLLLLQPRGRLLWGDLQLAGSGRGSKVWAGTNCEVVETLFDPAYTPCISLTQRQPCIRTYAPNPFADARYRTAVWPLVTGQLANVLLPLFFFLPSPRFPFPFLFHESWINVERWQMQKRGGKTEREVKMWFTIPAQEGKN